MKVFSRRLAIISFLLISAVSTRAQSVEFSADMRVADGTGRTQALKIFVGNKRARFDLLKQGNDPSGIGSILIDFQNQFIFLLIPQAKLYLQIEGSAGTGFYNGAWMLRPSTPPISLQRMGERGGPARNLVTLQKRGPDSVDGKPTQKWDATTADSGQRVLRSMTRSQTMGILTWFAATLRQYPEIAIFLTLAIGYYFSKFSFKGIGLGSVSAAVLGAIGEPNAGLTTFSQAPVVTPRQIQFALKLDF
jgi:hypothetical protein